MALLTQRKAIAEIRERAGLSEASAIEKVRAMVKTKDGCRDKVTRYQVELVIAETNEPPMAKKEPNVYRMSPRKRARAAAWGEMPRTRTA